MGQRAHVQVRNAIIAITDEMFHPNGGPYHGPCRSCVKEGTACVGRPYRLIEYRSITTDGFPLWIRPACKTCIRLQRWCSCGTTSTDVGYHCFSDNHDPEPSHVRRSGVSWNVILNSVSARADVFAPSPPESSRAAAAAAGVTGTQPGSGEDATGSPQTPSGGGGRGTAQDPPSPHTPQRPSSPSAEDSPHNSPIRRYVDKGKSKAKDVLRQSPVGRFLPRLWQSRTEKKGRKTPSPPHLLDARLRGRLRAIAVIAG